MERLHEVGCVLPCVQLQRLAQVIGPAGPNVSGVGEELPARLFLHHILEALKPRNRSMREQWPQSRQQHLEDDGKRTAEERCPWCEGQVPTAEERCPWCEGQVSTSDEAEVVGQNQEHWGGWHPAAKTPPLPGI
eukprot:EG_transcript_48449